jgi:hypothetical protein
MRRNIRRALLLTAVCLGLSALLLGQMEPLDAEQAVRQAFAHANEGFTSTDVKELGWLGDASAVALTKVVGGRVLDGRDIESMLLVITLSYEDPRIIRADSDREPRTTLLLLRYLGLATSDTKLKAKIVETKRYVTDQYASFGRGGREPTTIQGPK